MIALARGDRRTGGHGPRANLRALAYSLERGTSPRAQGGFASARPPDPATSGLSATNTDTRHPVTIRHKLLSEGSGELCLCLTRDIGGVSLVTAERNPEHAGGAGSLQFREPCRISLVTADTVPEVLALPHRVPSLGRAVERFLAAKPLSPNGRRSYAHTLGTVIGDLGADLALDEFTAERVRRVLEARWGDASAATWNNRLTALGSFRRWAQAQGWITEDPLAGIERRPQPRDEVAPIRYEQLHALWTRPDVHVREKTLWRMLYETAARANEVLALNVGGPRPRSQAGCGQGQRRPPPRSRVGFGNRPPPTPPSGQPAARSGVRHPPPTQRGAGSFRPVSRHRPGSAVVSAGLEAVPQRVGLDAAPAAPLRPHPPRRERGRGTAAESQKPPPQPAQPRPVRTAWYRSGSGTHR